MKLYDFGLFVFIVVSVWVVAIAGPEIKEAVVDHFETNEVVEEKEAN